MLKNSNTAQSHTESSHGFRDFETIGLYTNQNPCQYVSDDEGFAVDTKILKIDVTYFKFWITGER